MARESINPLSVNVQCLDALEAVFSALGRFGVRGVSCLQEYERRYQSNWAELMDSLESRRSDASAIEDALASLDDTPDEDTGEDPNADRRAELQGDLSLAEMRVDAMTAVMRQVQDAYEDFTRHAGAFAALVGEHIPRSQAVLRHDIDAIVHYRSITLDLSPGSSPPAGRAATLLSASLSPTRSGTDECVPASGVGAIQPCCPQRGGGMAAHLGTGFPVSLNDYPLPPDFQWVLVDEINPHQLKDVVGRDTYIHGVDYDTMRRGMELLQARILPAIAENMANGTYDYFYYIDQQEGAPPGQGLAAVYNAFFNPSRNSEVIHLQRGAAQTQYSIDNGRHRIRLAIDLGWRAIPAKCQQPHTGGSP